MDLKTENFYLVDKICYKAEGRENEEFGEFEVDYVFLSKVDTEPKYEMISEEVCEVAWVPRNGMEEFLESKKKEGCLFSPWFMKMYNNGLLFKWWDEVAVSKLVNPPSDAELPVREL
jgi:isopentenyldiphosphate isomerase